MWASRLGLIYHVNHMQAESNNEKTRRAKGITRRARLNRTNHSARRLRKRGGAAGNTAQTLIGVKALVDAQQGRRQERATDLQSQALKKLAPAF